MDVPPPHCQRGNHRREKRRPPISTVVSSHRIHHLFLALALVLFNILTSCAYYIMPTASSWLPTTPTHPRGINNYSTRKTLAHKRQKIFLLNLIYYENNFAEEAEDDERSMLLPSSPTMATKTTTATNSLEKSDTSASSSSSSSSTSNFGDSVPYTPASIPSIISSAPESQTISTNNTPNKIAIAIASFLLAILHYIYQFTHPTTAISLLSTMEQHSASLIDIGSNGKPTVIDFWAPWCANCRIFAPTLFAIEQEYQDRINFIVVNGDDARNYPLVQLLGVDAIPHVALLDSEGDVETALIGPISRRVLRADLDALLNQRRWAEGVDCGGGGTAGGSTTTGGETTANADVASPPAAITSTTVVCHDDLPYKMYDAFGYRSEDSRRIRFR